MGKQNPMQTRREFLKEGATVLTCMGLFPSYALAAPRKGSIITIFDDFGDHNNNIEQYEKLRSVNEPKVGAILVGGHLCESVCEHVKKNPDDNLELILHMPMEPIEKKGIIQQIERVPRKQGERYDSKKHFGIYSWDSPSLVKEIVANNIQYVQRLLGLQLRIIGANHHMGSAVTKDKNLMAAVAEVLSSHNMFYVNSRTLDRDDMHFYPEIKTAMQGKRVKYYERNHNWLDGNKTESPINRFEHAVEKAMSGKRIIAIGHLHVRNKKFDEMTVDAYAATARKYRNLFRGFRLR